MSMAGFTPCKVRRRTNSLRERSEWLPGRTMGSFSDSIATDALDNPLRPRVLDAASFSGEVIPRAVSIIMVGKGTRRRLAAADGAARGSWDAGTKSAVPSARCVIVTA